MLLSVCIVVFSANPGFLKPQVLPATMRNRQ